MSDKVPKGFKRSNKWATVRRHYLELNPVCELCGGKIKLEVHHIEPFHLNPKMELDQSNLITLCENVHDVMNCHLVMGHLGSFKSFNVNVRRDVKQWRRRIKERP